MNEVIDCIADYLGISKDNLSEDTDIQNDLGLSSFDLMDLSCELEEHFDISIDSNKLSDVHYIKDIIELIPRFENKKVIVWN